MFVLLSGFWQEFHIQFTVFLDQALNVDSLLLCNFVKLAYLVPETGYFSFITQYTVVFLKLLHYCPDIVHFNDNLSG
jgi:hypothetical protein